MENAQRLESEQLTLYIIYILRVLKVFGEGRKVTNIHVTLENIASFMIKIIKHTSTVIEGLVRNVHIFSFDQ